MFLKWSSFKLHCRANVCGSIPIQSTVIPSQPIIEWDFEDRVVMEPGPLHNEYHDRAMVYAAEADYASARGDRKLCDYLQFHSILCSRHLSHTKAITAHKKSNHPGQLQEAIALGNPEDASVHWESVSMQLLPCQFQQNASLSCFLAVGYSWVTCSDPRWSFTLHLFLVPVCCCWSTTIEETSDYVAPVSVPWLDSCKWFPVLGAVLFACLIFIEESNLNRVCQDRDNLTHRMKGCQEHSCLVGWKAWKASGNLRKDFRAICP